jgi:hypothetical protein
MHTVDGVEGCLTSNTVLLIKVTELESNVNTKSIRLGAGAGMWPDRLDAALEVITRGNIAYISFDTMAEATLPGMQKLRFENPEKGYTDIHRTTNYIMPICVENGVRLISNCGGANPLSAGKIASVTATDLGLCGTKIATVVGDDTTGEQCLARIAELRGKGVRLNHLDTGEELDSIKGRIIAMNVYLGAAPIVEALNQGAQIVITGRHTDSAMWLAPACYEFGWNWNDWDRLAAGVIVGHLMECSGHVTGGNFSYWQEVPDPARLGFPIAELYENGEAIITKLEGSGGMVSEATCKEQLVYELHDPSHYVTPDAIVDVTNLRFEQVGKDRVKFSGVKGRPKPETLKACIGYRDGYIGQVLAFYAWPEALAKARRAEEILRERFQMRALEVDDIKFDYIGFNSLHGTLSPEPEFELNEVCLRTTIKSPRESDIAEVIREVYALDLSGPAAQTGVVHLPTREMIAMWPTLIPREEIKHEVFIAEIR